MNQHIIESLAEARQALDTMLATPATLGAIGEAAALLCTTLERGNRVFSCGNGGSMCDAMHFAEELSGRYRMNRRGLPAVAISDPGHLSCVANDYGYEYVFSRYLEAHARAGDCVLAISTSGTSVNIVTAAQEARRLGLATIGLTGRMGSAVGAAVDLEICTPAGRFADRVQELHIKVIHILIELVERKFFPENYLPAG